MTDASETNELHRKDASWEDKAVESGVSHFIGIIFQNNPSVHRKLNIPKLHEFVRDKLKNLLKFFPIKHIPFSTDVIRDDAIGNLLPAPLLQKLLLLKDECYERVVEYRRISWHQIGRKTKRKSSDRKEFNQMQSEEVKRIFGEYEDRMIAMIRGEGIALDDIESQYNLFVRERKKSKTLHNLLDAMRISAQEVLSREAQKTEPEVHLFEGGKSGASPLRQFVDDGGILHAINGQAQDQTFIPREGEKIVETKMGPIIVPEE